MKIAKAAGVYFALVFGIGFVLGIIRTIWVVPLVGVRSAELMEAPLMLFATWIGARWVNREFSLPDRRRRLAVGFWGLVLLLTAEAGMVSIRGMTMGQYISSRDRVSGSIYLALLVIFGGMPWLAGGR